MTIRINSKFISIPPFISTEWPHVIALYIKERTLVIVLIDGEAIQISNLSPSTIELIFKYHAAYLEKDYDQTITHSANETQQIQQSLEFPAIGETSFRLAFGAMDGLHAVMQHNPAQAQAPDLPPEILQKISTIAKIMTPEEILLPQAEAGCNCFHCQIARAIHPSTETEVVSAIEEDVADADLSFQQWMITQTGEQLFFVVNKLDQNEHYNVFLGQPVGCTCGQEGCEHILAVLKS